jgi:sulfoxide reductase heme-binding subunit YedZ
VYPALAVVCTFATAAIEFAWYGLTSHINPWRVLAANETIRFGLRPAHYVGLIVLAVAVVMIVRRATPPVLALLRRVRTSRIRAEV